MPTPISIIQFGLGGVGRALVQQVFATREAQARHGIALRYVAVADSAGAIVGERGLDESVVESAARLKERGGNLHEHEAGYFQQSLAALIDLAGQPGTVVVDTTAAEADSLLPAFDLALSRGYALVLANKKPLTASLETWQRLTGEGRAGYEATVGAGLPVISTLRHLLDTGDEVHRIEGVLSGTLGYLMSQLQEGAAFGAAVREAKARGWTEPDPRDDLSGMDVARKMLILARTLGYTGELEDVSVTPLYPASFAALPLDDFMARLDELDADLAAQRDEAHRAGQRLRYAATIHPGGSGQPAQLRAGPTSVPADSPLGALRGPDNLLAFYTSRYAARPLVVQGAGAGVEVTASALLGDILRLAHEAL
jgi:homoserine dehydrogenase